MHTPIFRGAATALITPMKPDGSIHYKAMELLVDYQLSHGIDGLVVAGTTGEAPTLSKEEYQTLVTQVVQQVKGAVPGHRRGPEPTIPAIPLNLQPAPGNVGQTLCCASLPITTRPLNEG